MESNWKHMRAQLIWLFFLFPSHCVPEDVASLNEFFFYVKMGYSYREYQICFKPETSTLRCGNYLWKSRYPNIRVIDLFINHCN